MTERSAQVRRGFLGGSFDPVHTGHLLIAQDALEQCQLDTVSLIPSPHAPLRDRAPGASPAHRVGMLRAAVEGNPQLSVDTLEVESGQTAYTVDTAARLRKKYPDDMLFWIVGSDHLEKLAQWREPERLLELMELIVLARPGYELTVPAGFPPERFHLVRAHPFEVSSTEVRQRMDAGLPVHFFLPPVVADYIAKNRLYRD